MLFRSPPNPSQEHAPGSTRRRQQGGTKATWGSTKTVATQREDDEDLDEDGGGAQRRARPRRPPNTSNRSTQIKPNRSQLHTPGPIALIPCRNQASNMEDSLLITLYFLRGTVQVRRGTEASTTLHFYTSFLFIYLFSI